MGGTHGLSGSLYVPRSSPIHRLAPQCKLAATVPVRLRRRVHAAGGVLGVRPATSRCSVVVIGIARLPPLLVLRRLAIELPFVAFALLLPIVGQGERVDVLGVSLSVAGLWGAWNILVKATIGVAASVVLSSTTPIAEILHGLDRLHVPKVFVSICAFMIRYGDVISAEMRRMRIARESRGHNPRWIWQAKAVAASAGALFIRSYERGERVFLAMVSRGLLRRHAGVCAQHRDRQQWLAALSLPAAATAISLMAWAPR